jgi:hypothetical protein
LKTYLQFYVKNRKIIKKLLLLISNQRVLKNCDYNFSKLISGKYYFELKEKKILQKKVFKTIKVITVYDFKILI